MKSYHGEDDKMLRSGLYQREDGYVFFVSSDHRIFNVLTITGKLVCLNYNSQRDRDEISKAIRADEGFKRFYEKRTGIVAVKAKAKTARKDVAA